MRKVFCALLRLEAERIADFEVKAVAELAGEGDDLRIAQKGDDVGLLGLRIVELEGAERFVGEDIDAQ